MQFKTKKLSRLKRVRASLASSARPRLSVHRSNQHMWAQIIDDASGKTLVSFNTKTLKSKKGETKTIRSTMLGTEIAKLALKQKITKIVFDRGPYKYHGRVKALAEAARSGGLEF